jgi:undecaprenyl-phosphate galactose phosphotransferase
MDNEVLAKQQVITKEKIANLGYIVLKRFIDIIGGIVGLILLIPMFVIIKILYILTGDFNKIIFTQNRIGKNGKEFKLYKFRTMIKNADEYLFKYLEENEEAAIEYKRYKKLKNDPRITKVGKFIRKFSIDEFPQFINVLKGNMSIVGPRPYLPREKEDMGEYFKNIIKVKPGITGFWQVNGRSATTFGQRLVMDEFYSNHNGMVLDLKIMIKTFLQFLGKDAR